MNFIRVTTYDTNNWHEAEDIYIKADTISAIYEQRAGNHRWRLIWFDSNFSVTTEETVEEIKEKISWAMQ